MGALGAQRDKTLSRSLVHLSATTSSAYIDSLQQIRPNGFTRNDHDTVALPTFHANRENKPVYAMLQVKFLIINRSGIRACHNHHNAFGDEIVLIKLPVKKKQLR